MHVSLLPAQEGVDQCSKRPAAQHKNLFLPSYRRIRNQAPNLGTCLAPQVQLRQVQRQPALSAHREPNGVDTVHTRFSSRKDYHTSLSPAAQPLRRASDPRSITIYVSCRTTNLNPHILLRSHPRTTHTPPPWRGRNMTHIPSPRAAEYRQLSLGVRDRGTTFASSQVAGPAPRIRTQNTGIPPTARVNYTVHLFT